MYETSASLRVGLFVVMMLPEAMLYAAPDTKERYMANLGDQ
jgi:hypothetical protein